ncbi:septum formation initiator family protein [bacterium]|nr:septum formation initiator family protein [bacterium]
MKFLIAVVLSTITAIALIYIFQSKGPDFLKARSEEKKLSIEIRNLRDENDKLKKEIYLLKTDPFYLEKYARDTFQLAASNEIIFKFDE